MPFSPALPLPQALTTAVTQQSAVLFLGAGASYGATHPNNDPIPGGDRLRSLLSDNFLGGRLKHRTLAHVAELCISETDLPSVQSFVRDIFLPFEPADHHLIIPRFFWHAIVTTNYDLVIERAYSAEPRPRQSLTPFTNDTQRIDTALRTTVNGLRYIKLHGCIDRLENNVPLILSTEQYTRYASNRQRLFETFRGYGYEHTIVFCGYSIDDPHIQTILFDLTDLTIQRPRYYIVSPDLDDSEHRYWERHRISCIRATFEQFLLTLENEIPKHRRAVSPALGGGTTTARKFYRTPNPTETDALKLFLTSDVDHVRTGITASATTPRDFYLGADTGWNPIESELDIRRDITDNIVSDAILEEEPDRQRLVDLHVIKGPAGHGKTTTLRRVAWDASTTFSKLCLFVREEGTIRTEQLRELSDLTKERIFLFIDRAALRMEEILTTIETASSSNVPVTIVTAERDNEWNVRCAELDEYVAQEYPLPNLSRQEVHSLLRKLDENSALGRLADLTYDQRAHEFLENAKSQLLVALHEATLGRPFEEIVRDEYARIVPAEARKLYLDVCTLNRFGVPVRAGLVSRVSGIRFEDFRRRFLKPLQHVVRSHYDSYVGDRMYSARHQHIADLVFQLALEDPEARYDQMIRILEGMNILYTSDYEAFRSLVRGRAIRDTFGSRELGRKFYDRAEWLAKNDSYLLQQRALFEMHHPGGDLAAADRHLQRASSIAPYDKSIVHTCASLRRRQASDADNPLLRDKLRRKSREGLYGLLRTGGQASDYHTLILLLVDQLRDLLAETEKNELDNLQENVIVDLIRDIESRIRESQQRFPDDERLLTAEARFRETLKEDRRALEAMRNAFHKNPRSEWVAIRLNRRLSEEGEHAEAHRVLQRCLSENPGSKAVSFELANYYMKHGDREQKHQILQLLRRSFVDGDVHFDAQYWYARELFIRGDGVSSHELFSRLKHAPVSPSVRNRMRGFIEDGSGIPKRFRAVVKKKEVTYLFAKVSEYDRDIYCHVSQVPEGVWEGLRVGQSIELSIGFSMRGPAATIR